ncbi:MAG: acyl--CoA ligase, partial [Nitrosospira sp.]|nr:acyl--CoA ligase [Nitrosospira sp.]
MLSDAQIRADLAQLKEIAAAHKAPGTAFATAPMDIAGQQLEVFRHIPRNLGEIYALAMATPAATFLVYQEERFSFAETLTLAAAMARVLQQTYAIQHGDRVAICARNSPEWCIAYMAITLMGAVVVPMNSWWRSAELEYGLRDSGARLMFADPARIALATPCLKQLGVEVIAIKPEPASPYPEFYALAASLPPLTPAEIIACNVQPEDNVSIMYTSGSTGEPKGVLSTHRNITHALYTWKFIKEINEILRPELVEENPEFPVAILANVPLFHVTGSHAQFLASFLYARKFVMMYKWDAAVALQLIEKERISVFHGVPTMTWELMQAEQFAHTDLRSLRAVQSGGAPRPPEHLSLMLQRFPDRALPGLGYGLTETNAIGAIITGDFYKARPNSTGRPSPPVTTIKISDEAGNSLPEGAIGEICIKGPTVMKGYWNKPAESAAVIRDGWFYSGDIGMLDECGFLIIIDRAKDIVIRGGENIGCAEVEYAISEHPAVNEVSVYGIPDIRLGEVPCATVMLKPGRQLDTAELLGFLQTRIASFKIPHKVFFQYEQLP